MTDRLDRKPLAERLADEIESGIREGRWKGTLPGYRVLAEDYGVSWRTGRTALQLLEKRGLLFPFEHGKPRRIREPQRGEGHPHRNLLVVTSSTTLPDIAEQELLDEMIQVWTRSGGDTQQVRVDFRRHRRPASVLQKLIQTHSADVLVIREPSKPWVDAARSLSEPVYFLGGEVPVSERNTVSGFGASIIEMVTDSVRKLRRLGHERILSPDEGFGPIIRDAVLTGIRNGYGKDVVPPHSNLCCPVFPETEPETWQSYWARAFREYRPTAAIVRKESSYLSLIGFCIENDIRIPEDLSVVCHSASENLRWCYPQPEQTTFPKRRAVAHFRRWIKNGYPLTGLKIFPVDFVGGGTVKCVLSR